MPEPVAEVVPRSAGRQPPAAGRSWPSRTSGSRRRSALDDQLEVRLHALGLARELGAVGVRESRPGLRLELVGGDVLGGERERLVEVACEIGGRSGPGCRRSGRARCCRIRHPAGGERASDVVGPSRRGRASEQLRLERLCAERDAIDPAPSAAVLRDAGVTVSGFASTVSSSHAGSAASRRSSSAGCVNVGVPPPRYTSRAGAASRSRSRSSSASSASTYAPCSSSRPTTVTKSQ